MFYKDQKYRINNIHVHSKDLKDYCSLTHKPGFMKIHLAKIADRYIPETFNHKRENQRNQYMLDNSGK